MITPSLKKNGSILNVMIVGIYLFTHVFIFDETGNVARSADRSGRVVCGAGTEAYFCFLQVISLTDMSN